MPPKRSSTARKPLAKQTSRLAFLHGALTQDIRLLVSEFCKDGNALDFETFKTVWASLDFGLVHLGCREQYDRGPYMDMVFNVIIELLFLGRHWPFRVGLIFALYMVHETQPSSFPKSLIRMTTASWREVQWIEQAALRLRQWDVVHVCRKLRQSNSYHFCLWSGASAAREAPELVPAQGIRDDTVHNEFAELENELVARDLGGLGRPHSLLQLKSVAAEYYESRQALEQALQVVSNERAISEAFKLRSAAASLAQSFQDFPADLHRDINTFMQGRLDQWVAPLESPKRFTQQLLEHAQPGQEAGLNGSSGNAAAANESPVASYPGSPTNVDVSSPSAASIVRDMPSIRGLHGASTKRPSSQPSTPQGRTPFVDNSPFRPSSALAASSLSATSTGRDAPSFRAPAKRRRSQSPSKKSSDAASGSPSKKRRKPARKGKAKAHDDSNDDDDDHAFDDEEQADDDETSGGDDDSTCAMCRLGSSKKGNEIVFCSSCDRPYHQTCHRPKITAGFLKPNVDWFCTDCDPYQSTRASATSARAKCYRCDKSSSKASMLQCADCSHVYHPSCHEHAADELAFLRTFDWRCSNCTRCQVCLRTDEDDKMALCDKCDRGLHTYCASPPITVDLKDLDSFICPLCTGQ